MVKVALRTWLTCVVLGVGVMPGHVATLSLGQTLPAVQEAASGTLLARCAVAALQAVATTGCCARQFLDVRLAVGTRRRWVHGAQVVIWIPNLAHVAAFGDPADRGAKTQLSAHGGGIVA